MALLKRYINWIKLNSTEDLALFLNSTNTCFGIMGWESDSSQRDISDSPLRPILFMTGSSHYELGKWLAGLLQPVLERFSLNCILDSFTFAKTMQNLNSDLNVLMCSFDVSSLFINVSLDDTTKICSEAFYDESDFEPIISKDVFVELMISASITICTSKQTE